MSEPIISARGISKRYRLGQIGMTSFRDEIERMFARFRSGPVDEAARAATEYWALRDISFDIYPGEVVGVVGRNGAGKSTLLKILSRITEPTSGEIHVHGRIGSLLEVGTGFHPELSGRDNIFLNGAILGMTRAEVATKFDAIVAFSEIGQFLDTPVKRYSSGMYVRLAFAVAAHLEPEILIVDEVLAVGDAQFQRKCISRMQDIARDDHRTILFVSHSMPAVRRLCKRCIVLEGGRMLGVFPTEQAIELYNQKVVASAMSIDVREAKREVGSEGKLCRFHRIGTRDGRGLVFNEPLDLVIDVYAPAAIDQVMLGFSFATAEGQRILTLDSDALGQMLTLAPGMNRIELRLPQLPLHPAPYYCSAALGFGNAYYDLLDGFALWEVNAGKNDWESDRGFGGCRIAPTVTARSLPA